MRETNGGGMFRKWPRKIWRNKIIQLPGMNLKYVILLYIFPLQNP